VAIRTSSSRRPWIFGAIAVVVLAGAYWTWRHLSPRESTDDAQVSGHVSPVAARVGGPILAIHVKDNQTIAAGDGSFWVLHTPGHAPDHLAFLELRSSILFCGDLLVNGGTIAINPSAGGDMARYLESLRRLLEDQPRRIYPGHGPPVDNPGALIRAYIAHRLGREQQILDELAKASGTEEELTGRVYPEVGPELQAAARENLRAHLLKLQGEGRAVHDAGIWRRPS